MEKRRKLVMETAYLHQVQLEALRARKPRTRISVAEQIRDAVTEYLRRRGFELAELSVADAAEVGGGR